MDKREYLKLKQLPIEKLTLRQCREMDKLVKELALAEFDNKLPHLVSTPAVRNFVQNMVRCQFGSAEVDKLLLDLDCYPKWLGLTRT